MSPHRPAELGRIGRLRERLSDAERPRDHLVAPLGDRRDPTRRLDPDQAVALEPVDVVVQARHGHAHRLCRVRHGERLGHPPHDRAAHRMRELVEQVQAVEVELLGRRPPRFHLGPLGLAHAMERSASFSMVHMVRIIQTT
jgi:hypothetical protein